MCSHSKSQIAVLQRRSQQALLEAIVAFIFAIFLSLFLPQLLFRYLYAGQPLLEEPALLSNIPLLSFTIGLAYLLMVIWGNWRREAKINSLEAELDMCDCGHDHGHQGSKHSMSETPDLAEMEALVDEILKEAEEAVGEAPKKKKSARKAASKITTKSKRVKKSSKK